MNPLSPENKQALADANRNVPKGWRAQTPLMRQPNGNVGVPKESPVRPHFDIFDIFDIFDKQGTPKRLYPHIPLQGKAKPAPTDVNPATGQPYGKYTSGPQRGETAVSPDHIVPKAEVVQMPRFTELTPEQQWAVVNSPNNLAWLGTRTNYKKGARDVADMAGVKPEWQAEYKRLQDQKRKEVQEMIDQFADSNAH